MSAISWVRDLGNPLEAGTYNFDGARVQVLDKDVKRAAAELSAGATDVHFNLIPAGPSKRVNYILGTITTI